MPLRERESLPRRLSLCFSWVDRTAEAVPSHKHFLLPARTRHRGLLLHRHTHVDARVYIADGAAIRVHPSLRSWRVLSVVLGFQPWLRPAQTSLERRASRRFDPGPIA